MSSASVAVFVVRLERRHRDLRAERGVGEGDVHARDEVGPVALEARVLLDVDLDVEIARRARRSGPGMPCPGTRSRCPASMPAGNVTFTLRGSLHRAVPGARGARLLDDAPGAAAARARRREHDEAARVRHLARAAALRARLGLAPGLGAAAASNRCTRAGARSCTSRLQPNAASRSVRRVWTRMSPPRRGRALPPKPIPPENISAKRSCMWAKTSPMPSPPAAPTDPSSPAWPNWS